MIDWGAITAIATAISGITLVGSALLIVAQLRRQAQEQFVTATATIFQVWMDDDFQRAHQMVLYDLREQTWREFVAKHRGQPIERAFIRVGSFYNRVGYLVTHRLVGTEDRLLLDTLAGPAIAVWRQIEPLVLEARLVENATIFTDFQRMLPECYECYVPNQPVPMDIQEGAEEAARISGDER
jgi:hypothetical protein